MNQTKKVKREKLAK